MAISRLRYAGIGAILLAAGSAGCGGARTRSPEGTLDRFAAALRMEDHAEAYALLSEEYRARVSYDAFVRLLEEAPDEVAALSTRVAAREAEAEVTAELDLGGGDTLHLILEDGEWRLLGNVVDFYDQSTPRAALRSFVRAMGRRRYDVVMRFVPRADLEGMSEERMRAAWEGEGREEIDRLLTQLRAAMNNPIEEVGDRATMAYGQRHRVQFVREDGVWKIEDPD